MVANLDASYPDIACSSPEQHGWAMRRLTSWRSRLLLNRRYVVDLLIRRIFA
ncbi:hypothetical protein OAE79_01535 [Rhodopirellula sp.]|nr:hypothetical protein [Rhodopirellula sp.]